MKHITANELRTKTKNELDALLRETKELVRALSFDAHLGRLKKVKDIGKNKKVVARILTVLETKN